MILTMSDVGLGVDILFHTTCGFFVGQRLNKTNRQRQTQCLKLSVISLSYNRRIARFQFRPCFGTEEGAAALPRPSRTMGGKREQS